MIANYSSRLIIFLKAKRHTLKIFNSSCSYISQKPDFKMTGVKSRFLTVAALAALALAGSANGQRIGMYPLETSDSVLALAVPTAVARSLETIDGAILPAPLDLFSAVRQRPAFLATLDKVFSLQTLINGKLEGTAGSYTITYSLKRGTETKSAVARGADFAALVKNSNASLITALGLKPNSTDSQQLAAVERSLPAADVVTASAAPGSEGNGAILEKGGQNPWALAGRALVLIGANKRDEALVLMNTAAKAAPNDPFVQAAHVVALVAARKNPEAKTAIDTAIKLNPAKPEIHYLNGRFIMQSTTPINQAVVQRALDALQLALQYNPRYIEAAVTAADILEQYGNTARAVDVLTALVARMPDDVSLHNRVLDTLMEQDREGAVAYLQEVIKTYPDVPDTVYSLATRLFDTDAANQLVGSGETRYSSSATLALARGNLLERIGDYTGAVAAYRESLGRDPKFQRANLALAATLSKQGKFDDAESTLKLVYPNNLDQKLVVRMYIQTGRLERAKTILARLPQTDFDAVYLTGIAALREYRADDAAKTLEAATKLNNTNNQVKASQTEVADVRRLGAPKLTGEALYQFRLGQGLIDAQNPLEALTALNRAVKLAPTDLHALLYRGVALLQTANPDDARDAFIDLVKLAPNNTVVHTFLAIAELGRQRYDLAIEAANKAIALDKTYARAYFVLGNVYYQQYNVFGTSSDVTAARDAFTRCVGADATYRILVDRFLNALPK
jgi:tetratricopeptide (TPR) repeat protein